MYRLMIVDDEQRIVEGLKSLIPWQQHDFEVVGEAYDGSAAVSEALACRPDVIITDIRMPQMDGYAMIDALKEAGLDCQYIILSGYDDFEFAQDALRREVFFYLLKPIQKEELLTTLEGIKEKLTFKRQRKEELESLRLRLREVWPAAQERYLGEMMTDEMLSRRDLERRWRLLAGDAPLGTFCAVLMEMDGIYAKLGDRIEEILLLEYAMRNVAEELAEEQQAGMVFGMGKGRLCLLCHGGANAAGEVREKAMSFAGSLQQTIQIIFEETVSAGIGGVYEGIEHLPQTYQEAHKALRYRMVLGNNSLIDIADIRSIVSDFHVPAGMEKQLLNSVELGEQAEIVATLDRFFQAMERHEGCQPEYISNACVTVLAMARSSLLSYGVPAEELEGMESLRLSRLEDCLDLDVMQVFMREALLAAAQRIEKARSEKMYGVMWQVRQYVEEHYSEEISLNLLAQIFYLNPNYLSHMFKREMGCNYIDYLTGLRIENAKKLLLDPESKVYEVCRQVGYGNQRYFSRLFEKYTGHTPSQYKKLKSLAK